jgi:hypothetical protein
MVLTDYGFLQKRIGQFVFFTNETGECSIYLTIVLTVTGG